MGTLVRSREQPMPAPGTYAWRVMRWVRRRRVVGAATLDTRGIVHCQTPMGDEEAELRQELLLGWERDRYLS